MRKGKKEPQKNEPGSGHEQDGMGRRNAESSPCPGEPQIKPPHEQHITAGTPAGGPKKPSLLLQYATEKPPSLLDPLLALLGVGVPRRAQTALVPSHERAE